MAEEIYKLSTTCQIKGLSDIYLFYLGYKNDGVFVEFGAYDGENCSNTSGLADIGWTGLYVEPVTDYYKKCKDRHKKNLGVKVVNCAVGDKNGSAEIHLGGPLSTIRDDVLDKFKSMKWSKNEHGGKKETVNMMLLEKILIGAGIPKNFDVLSVDVEGYEWLALRDFDIREWGPKIVIIELHDNNENYSEEWPECNKLIEYFDENGYRVVWKDFGNTVYARKEAVL